MMALPEGLGSGRDEVNPSSKTDGIVSRKARRERTLRHHEIDRGSSPNLARGLGALLSLFSGTGTPATR